MRFGSFAYSALSQPRIGGLASPLAALRRIDLAPSSGAIAQPGLEPGSQEYESRVLPLPYRAMCDIITAQQYTSRFREGQPWLFCYGGEIIQGGFLMNT